MALETGTRLGPYEIQAALGAGGMGEVYRAKDTRLDRTVAIKVLPAHFSGNVTLRQRFEREARAISSLSHPNICALYDVGNQNGIEYLVMEYIEGETLADRLKKGPLPKEQVLRHGIEIAEALDKAHKQGIVHRDLKPTNIMLTKSGAKLLDFGLAKLRAAELVTPVSEASYLPTETNDHLTTAGTVLGTFHYMAPEQLEGRETDARSDIFTLGILLYEMATGQRPFGGQSRASIITAILLSDPVPVTTVKPLLPAALDHIIGKALAKDPDDRWQSARDVAGELKWISEGGSQSAARTAILPVTRRLKPKGWLFPILSAAFLLTTLFLGIAYFRSLHAPQNLQPFQLSVLPPPKTMLTNSIAISPNGRKLVVATNGSDGQKNLWVRSLDSSALDQLPQTEDGTYPFWSPDGRYIAFFTQNKLKKMEITGAPPQVLCDVSNARGGAWNRNGQMLISPSFTTALYQISATGGALKPITTLNESLHETSHRWPVFLPDGNHFLYVVLGAERKNCGIFVSSLDNPKQKRQLLGDFSTVQYVAPGYLLFTRGTTLMAQGFDPEKLQLKGEAFSLREKVGYDGYTAYGNFSISENNVLTYVGPDAIKTELLQLDRSGKQLGRLGEPSDYAEPRLSPDGKKMVVERIDPETSNYDLWIVELTRGTFTRFTFDSSNDVSAIWSPDGQKIVFCSNAKGTVNIFQKAASGSGTQDLVVDTPNPKYPTDWSRDGKYILFDEVDPKFKFDLWILPTSGDRKPWCYLQSQFNESHAQFSPDARWIAFSSDETGRSEIYVQSFPASSGGKWQISSNGGDQAQWSQDGKELYYMGADNRLMVVKVNADATFNAGVPTPLFQTSAPPNTMTDARNQYVIGENGKNFILVGLARESSVSPITVMLNWTERFKQ